MAQSIENLKSEQDNEIKSYTKYAKVAVAVAVEADGKEVYS